MFTAIIRYPKNQDMSNEFATAESISAAKSRALADSANNCPRTLEVLDSDGRTVSGPINVPLVLASLGE